MATFSLRPVMAIHLGLEAQFLNYLVWGLGSWSAGAGVFSSPLACGLSLILLSGGTFSIYGSFGGP